MANSVKRLLSLSRDSLRESLFRNIGVPYRNMIGLLLGITASFLPLITGVWIMRWVIWVFVGTLVLTMVLLVLVRPNVKKDSDQFAWGLLVIITLGFGLGALIYQAKPWWIWLWRQYLRINEPHELLLEALFLLGIIMGFFVVRNWAKEQADFVSSLSGVLGGAFVATILGDLQKELTPLRAFAYYGLGFAISGSINLLAAARLTAMYTNKGTMTSRSILDFLYGSERAKMIDGYFLKNYEEDPDYAKRYLTDTLIKYRELAASEFAERIEKRRKTRLKDRDSFKKTHPDERIENLERRWKKLEPFCGKLQAASEELEAIDTELEVVGSALEAAPKERASKLQERRTQLKQWIQRLESKCSADQLGEWKTLDKKLAQLKPSYFYQLIAIEREEQQTDIAKPNPELAAGDVWYDVIYKHIGPEKMRAANDDSRDSLAIHKDMFRVGISVKRQEFLEYIVAPGAYGNRFPYFHSVAGLALSLPQTIVMDRDIDKTFRSKNHAAGIRPRDIEQSRGRDIIDFLSYVSIPIVRRLGKVTELRLGVVHVDTRLFVSRSKLEGQPVKGEQGTFRAHLRRSELTEFANNLYEPDDEALGYLQELSEIIKPVLELYSKCRVGAT